MASGIAVADDVVDKYLQFKMKKEHKFLTFRISDDKKQIIVEDFGGAYDGPYSQFEDYLKGIEDQNQGSCRYAVVYYHYETTTGQPRTKIVFVSYTSANAKTKERMIYSASKSPLKMKLEGADLEIQGDLDDVKDAEVLDNIRRKFKD